MTNSDPMPQATFVLSTGRCGTQWLAHAFAAVYRDCLRVEHEPLHDRYLPRRLLGLDDFSRLPPSQAQPILKHLDGIEATLADRSYFETGHPCWSSLPCLARRFPGRIRVIHLVRHPIPTAYSWVSNGVYVPPVLPHLPAKEFITPFDDGVRFGEYQKRWPSLQPWEKCLYYWAEVNAFALYQEPKLGVPWLRVSYECLFTSKTLAELAAFLGLLERPTLMEAAVERIDDHHFLTAHWTNPRQILDHPRVIEVAEKLGYDVSVVNEPALRAKSLGG